ncbi:MAG: hypothetical protein ACOX7K_09825 [Oscillospiraceae bacterium]
MNQSAVNGKSTVRNHAPETLCHWLEAELASGDWKCAREPQGEEMLPRFCRVKAVTGIGR